MRRLCVRGLYLDSLIMLIQIVPHANLVQGVTGVDTLHSVHGAKKPGAATSS